MASQSTHRLQIGYTFQHVSEQIKNKKTQSYFAITLSLFFLSFFGLFAIRPTLITGISLMKKVSDLNQLTLAYEEKIQTLVRAQTEYGNIRDELPLIDSAMPAGSSFPSLARKFEAAAVAEGVTLQQFQIDNVPVPKTRAAQGLQSYGFHMTASGNYSALQRYISSLLKWKRLMVLRSFELVTEGGTVSGTLRLTMKGETYYQP